MKIRDCMTRDVQLISPQDSIETAAAAMAEADTGALPVSDKDRLVGMVTDRDIAIRAIAAGKGPKAKVAEVMSSDIRYCFDDDSVADVLHNMSDLQVRRLPVLNRDKRLVGIVSLSDLALSGSAPLAGDALSGIARPGGEHSQTLH